jgi:ketosteroid isomerase-like protein
MKWKRLFFAALVLTAAAGSAVSATNEELARAVREAERAFARSMAERDLAAFESFVSDEALFFGGKGVLRGRAAVMAGWKRFFQGDEAPFSWEPEQVEVLDSGTLAISSGPVRDPEGRRIATFNSIWRLEADGRWRVIFDRGCPLPCEPKEPAGSDDPSPAGSAGLPPEAREACEAIYRAVLALPGTAVDRREGTYYDENIERDLTGCIIDVSGVWSELGGRASPGDTVYQLLASQGWRQEPRYSVDGPDGTFFALSKGEIWCFVRGQWDGGDDADSEYVPGDVYQFFVCVARFVAGDPGDSEGE